MLEQISINIHHDAITGTEREHVALDYSRRLKKAQSISEKEYSQELK